MKTILGSAIIITIALTAAGFAIFYHPAPQPIPVGVELMPPRPADSAAAPQTAAITTPDPILDVAPLPVADPTPAVAVPTSTATQKAKKPAGPPKPKPPLNPNVPQDMGRIALAFVGTDPDADAIWLDTINDPSIEPDARRELIEDLNQDGFPDTKNLTPDDLPMIENRLNLIEQEGPYAMDDINDAAYLEAYKDLLNMENKLLNQ